MTINNPRCLTGKDEWSTRKSSNWSDLSLFKGGSCFRDSIKHDIKLIKRTDDDKLIGPWFWEEWWLISRGASACTQRQIYECSTLSLIFVYLTLYVLLHLTQSSRAYRCPPYLSILRILERFIIQGLPLEASVNITQMWRGERCELLTIDQLETKGHVSAKNIKNAF